MSNLKKLLQHELPEVRQLAEKAEEYKEQRDQGKITATEYDYLCSQLLALREINITAYNAEQRRQFQQAVAIVRVFLGVIV